MRDRQWFVLYVLICLEVGIFLMLVPWSVIWERNYFLQVYPGLRPFLLDPTFRGAISGLGVANVYIVLHEVMERRRQTALSVTELLPSELHLTADAAGNDDRGSGRASSDRASGRASSDRGSGRASSDRASGRASSGNGDEEPRAFVTHEKSS
jgi:hypothetical protein